MMILHFSTLRLSLQGSDWPLYIGHLGGKTSKIFLEQGQVRTFYIVYRESIHTIDVGSFGYFVGDNRRLVKRLACSLFRSSGTSLPSCPMVDQSHSRWSKSSSIFIYLQSKKSIRRGLSGPLKVTIFPLPFLNCSSWSF